METIVHQGEVRHFRRVVLRGDGWGYALITNRETQLHEWWQCRKSGDHWQTTSLKVSLSDVLADFRLC